MLDGAEVGKEWDERLAEEQTTLRSSCPVGMGIITDNSISSCRLLGPLYFFPSCRLRASRSAGISLCCYLFFNLLPSCFVQILCSILLHALCLLRLSTTGMCDVSVFLSFWLKKTEIPLRCNKWMSWRWKRFEAVWIKRNSVDHRVLRVLNLKVLIKYSHWRH